MQDKLSTEKLRVKNLNSDTKIEVIIPTLNEEHTIGELIHDIRATALPMVLSIVVIDGGSTDRTLDICRKENVRFIIQKGKGKGNGMREAVLQSEADIINCIHRW